jgi:hypothetical protein
MKSEAQLLSEIGEAVDGLTFMSESDHPFEVLHWVGLAEISHEYLRNLSGFPADAPVEVISVDDLFRVASSEAEWKSAAERAAAKRYQALVRLLKENLNDLKVYRIGAINIAVYVVGRQVAGRWIGVSTRLIET